MEITFWGSRGSSPVTLDHDRALGFLERMVKRAEAAGVGSLAGLVAAARDGKLGAPLAYGGHTACTEVAYKGRQFFVDMGTGLRDAGTKYVGKTKVFDIFLTHLHWDHLMGLNFFIPIFAPGNTVRIHYVHKTAPESVKMLFNGVNFPVKWEQLQATVELVPMTLYETKTFGDVTVTPFALDHPGGSFGYRFEAGGKAAAIGFDGEYTRITPEDLGKDLPFYQNLDLLVFDAQYEMEELLHKHDWGHSSAMIGIDLALREGIKNLVLIHHDPWASDERLVESASKARRYTKMQMKHHTAAWAAQPAGPVIHSAYDGLKVVLK